MKKTMTMLILLLSLNSNLFSKEMTILDTNGKSYSVTGSDSQLKIEGMEGKVVFLEFFGLKCPACKQLMPNLINIKEKYKNSIEVMAIEVQNNDNDPINAYKKKHGINYPTFSNFDIGYMVRFIADKSGWQGQIPFIVAIDAKGNVRFTQAGILSEKTLEEYVEKFSK